MAYTMNPLILECPYPFPTDGLPCPACNRVQKSSSNFKTHAKRVHKTLDARTPTTCSVCGRTFDSYRAASAHFPRNHPEDFSPSSQQEQQKAAESKAIEEPNTRTNPRTKQMDSDLSQILRDLIHDSPAASLTSTTPSSPPTPNTQQLINHLLRDELQTPSRPTSTVSEPTTGSLTTTESPPKPTPAAPIPLHNRSRIYPNPEPQVRELVRHYRLATSNRRPQRPYRDSRVSPPATPSTSPPTSPTITPPPPTSYSPSATIQHLNQHLTNLKNLVMDPPDDDLDDPLHQHCTSTPTTAAEEPVYCSTLSPRPPTPPVVEEQAHCHPPSTTNISKDQTEEPAQPRTAQTPTNLPASQPDEDVSPPDPNDSREAQIPEGEHEQLEDFRTHWTQTFQRDLTWEEFAVQCELFADAARSLAATLFRPAVRPQPRQVTAAHRSARGRPIATYNPTEARRLQGLYRHSKKRAARKLLANNAPTYTGSVDAAHEFFLNTFSHKPCDTVALENALNDAVPSIPEDNGNLFADLQEREIASKLRSAANTAPGPDRVEYRHLKRVDPKATILSLIFNHCLRQKDVPKPWKDAATILIYKKGSTEEISNFRPIALMSCLYKLLMGVLGKRISTWAITNEVLSPEQKSARPAEGCYEHTYLMQSLIADARRNKRSLYVSWLDLRNAFGSVPHDTIATTLRHVGLPDDLVLLIMNAYSNATTTIRTNQGNTESIPLNAGVKQGCPMSPIIFNICLELVLRDIKKKAASIPSGQVKHFNSNISVLAYADDLVIVSRKKNHLQTLLNTASSSANTLGLQFRPDKCASLSFINVKKQDQRVDPNTFTVQNGEIPYLTREETYRYLGVPIGLIHNFNDIPTILPQIIEDLQTITSSLLAPWQKLDAIRTFVQPALTYALRAGFPTKDSLKPYRQTLIKSLRTICDLPSRNVQEYFFASKHAGGLAFQDPCKEDDIQAIVQAIRLLSSADPTVSLIASAELHHVVSRATCCNSTPALISDFLSGSTTGRCSNLNYAISNTWTRCRNACRRLKIQIYYSDTAPASASADDSAKIQAKHICSFLHRVVQQRAATTLCERPDQGKVAKCLANDQYGNGSCWSHTGLNIRFKDWRFIHKARLNLLPVNAVKSRWSATNPQCRHCPERETLPHITNHCNGNMVSIRRRHDKIVERLTNAIRFGEITTDRAVPNTNSRLRPDIIIEEDDQVLIIDVACPFDNGPEALDDAAQTKINKYQDLKEHFNNSGKDCVVLPFIIGALGSWYPPNEEVLRRLGMTKSYKMLFRKLCCSDSIQGSCDTFRLHVGWDVAA